MRHIGIDLHKSSFVACFLEHDDTYRFATYGIDADGLASFRADLLSDDRVAVEVGQSAFFFSDQISSAVAEVTLVATHNFAVIAKSKKKTDKNDALILARFLKLDCLPTVALPSPRIRELRRLFSAREALTKMSTQLKNMGHSALIRNGLPSRKADFASEKGRERLAKLEGLTEADRLILDVVLRQMEPVNRELDELERAIVRLGKTLPGVKQLLQVRGLGLVAAIGVLAEIGDIAHFASAKQLTSYAGLATAVRQSGGSDRHGHITRQGRKLLRGFVVEAVLSMIRNPSDGRAPLVDFYQRKKAEKGAGKAICATARKLLAVIFVMLTKGRDYWFLEERLYQKKLKALEKAEAAA
jgi:transposase